MIYLFNYIKIGLWSLIYNYINHDKIIIDIITDNIKDSGCVAIKFTQWFIPLYKQLYGIDVPRTGKPTRSGILVTKTLLFAGEGFGGDPIFRAHDKSTGNIVAEIELPATQASPPSSYRFNGKQYIVMTIADGKTPAELIALTIPDD